MSGSYQEVYLLAYSSEHYTAVLILVHWLKLLLPAALTCIWVIAV